MQKLRSNIKILGAFLLALSTCASLPSTAQNLAIVSSPDSLRARIKNDSLHQMVDLGHRIPQLIIDLRYATADNFTGRRLYPKSKRTYVRLAVARALALVTAELAAAGYGLKVWDAYRPYTATKKMWDLIGDERYVANPAKGSGHNRGLAIDLTLVQNGKEADMGTGFDHFSDTAHHSFTTLPVTVLQRRMLLRSVMEKNGFRALETEWWHYSWPNDRDYDVLDLSFSQLRKHRY